MALDSLKDVYLDQLQDIYSANKQSLDVTTELGRLASDTELSEALIAGVQGINDGMGEIASLCNAHDVNPEGAFCRGMEGLVREAKAHAIDAKFGNDAVRDAMIITQYQRMVHYAIAGYGCLRAFADRLGLDSDGAVLQRCLDKSYEGDDHMTRIATVGGVNADAA